MFEPKRIVFVIPDLKGNGAERVVLTLAKGVRALGHRVHIVCFKADFEFDTDGLDIHIFRMQLWRWVPRSIRGHLVRSLLDRFIMRVSEGIPNLVLSNLLPCDRILSKSRLPNVHLILHNTLSLDQRGTHTKAEIRLYQEKPVICVSDGVRADLLRMFPTRAGQSMTIHNPVEREWLMRAASEVSLQKALPNRYIVHVGKFKSEKRHDLLLKAFANADTTYDLVLLGQGPLMAGAQKLAQTLGIASRVHFLGFQTNPFPIVKNAALLTLCSDFEGLGMVLLEAIALGVPVISTDCPSGPNEILLPHQLTPVGDVHALAKQLSAPDFNVFKVALDEKFDLSYAIKRYLALADSRVGA